MYSVDRVATEDQIEIIRNAVRDREKQEIPLTCMTFALTKFTDAGLALYLEQYPSPQHLFLMGTEVTDDGIALLKDCPELEELGLKWTCITTDGLQKFEDKTRLRKLEINLDGVREGGFDVIAGFVNLRELRFEVRYGDPSIHYRRGPLPFTLASDLASLGGLKSLEVLGLRGVPLLGQDLEWLSRLHALHSIDLGNTQAAGEQLLHLRGLPDLHELQLSNTGLDDVTLVVLADTLSITDISLANTRVTDVGVRHLVSQGRLKSIFAEDVAWSSVTCKQLLLMPTLEWAELNIEGVSHEFLEDVAARSEGLWLHP